MSKASEVLFLTSLYEKEPDYPGIIANIARMIDNPRPSFADIKLYASRFANVVGVKLDMAKLKMAHGEFKGAKLSKAAYGRT